MTTNTHESGPSDAALFLDALLDIKRLAEKSGDDDTDPFALSDLIADRARTAIHPSTHE